ncbi:MAG: class I SAM-dependent methyltransferase [Gammaproteobacteria bacterium]|nr:class I SAM-dependent methyltransferase [Gammaproteobacteria bacterium]
MHQLYDKWICPKESLEKKLNAKHNIFLAYAIEAKLIANLIKKPNNKIKVLDYGMGWGHWLNMAKAFGYQTTGVELSEPRKNYAIKNGHRVLSNINHNGNYDFIYANQVFEHIPNPLTTIKELSKTLSPEGVILLCVPQGNKYAKISSFSNYQPKKDALHPLEHINCFNRNSLKLLGKTSGLRPIQPPFSILSDSISNYPKSCLRYIYDITISTKILFKKF